jgi:hypothetical protein
MIKMAIEKGQALAPNNFSFKITCASYGPNMPVLKLYGKTPTGDFELFYEWHVGL